MFSSRMDRLFSALLFLSLALDSSQQKQTLLSLTTAPTERGSPSTVKLSCTPPDKNYDHGVYWFRQPITKEPQFILSYSGKNEMAKDIDSTRFSHSKSTIEGFMLAIKDFRAEDQGTYHCLVRISSMLHLSNGVHVEYPTVTTPGPNITTTTTRRRSESCSCQASPDEGKSVMNSALDLSCSLYIWAPLAAVGGLLLIAFLATLAQLCKLYIRRKRCKHHVKKGPVNGNNGKPIVPNRFA